MNEINLDSFICYNWMPIISDHCLDLDEEFYRAAGVTRLHEQGRINADQIKDGDVVFIKTDYLYNGDFQKHIFPRIKNRFILVSGISSYHIGSNGDRSFIDMLNSPKLIKWFCTNPPDYKSDKIVPLPIGFEEKERPGGNQQSIADFYENRTDFKNKKDPLLYFGRHCADIIQRTLEDATGKELEVCDLSPVRRQGLIRTPYSIHPKSGQIVWPLDAQECEKLRVLVKDNPKATPAELAECVHAWNSPSENDFKHGEGVTMYHPPFNKVFQRGLPDWG